MIIIDSFCYRCPYFKYDLYENKCLCYTPSEYDCNLRSKNLNLNDK